MAKRVVKVNITGYYLVDEDMPEDILGMATTEEYIQGEIKAVAAGHYSAVDVATWMEESMSSRPTIRLELKPVV